MRTLDLLIVLFFVNGAFAQNKNQYLRTEYEVTRSFNAVNGTPIVYEVKYLGVHISNGKDALYWEEPLYLTDFPDGIITEEGKDGAFVGLPMSKSSRQNFVYFNSDSNLMRRSMDMAKQLDNLYIYRVLTKAAAAWHISAETKYIDNILCQNFENTAWSSVWVNTDLNLDMGPYGIYNAPGMVVMAEGRANKTKLILKGFSWVNMSDFSFWPKEFNGKVFEKTNPTAI